MGRIIITVDGVTVDSIIVNNTISVSLPILNLTGVLGLIMARSRFLAITVVVLWGIMEKMTTMNYPLGSIHSRIKNWRSGREWSPSAKTNGYSSRPLKTESDY